MRPNAERQESLSERLGSMASNIFTIAVCGYILHVADVVGVMQRSKKVYSSLLVVSYASYSIFFLIWVYLAAIVQRTNPNWENTHMNFIYVATAAVSIGGLTWTVALWPVFCSSACYLCCLQRKRSQNNDWRRSYQDLVLCLFVSRHLSLFEPNRCSPLIIGKG